MGTDILDTLIRAAAGVAFPAAIAVFLLVRMEAAVDRLRDQIGALTIALNSAFTQIRDDRGNSDASRGGR